MDPESGVLLSGPMVHGAAGDPGNAGGEGRPLDLGIEAKSEAPAEHAERLRSDIEEWRAVIEKAGIPKQ